MAEFILDACVLSETSKPRPHPNVIEFIRSADNLYVPIAVFTEIQRGISLLCQRSPLKAVKLANWYQEVFNAGLPVLDTTRGVAEVWGIMQADVRLNAFLRPDPRAKNPTVSQDLHIAAASIFYGIPIATFNTRDFTLINSCFELPGLYDPLNKKWVVGKYASLNEYGQLPVLV